MGDIDFDMDYDSDPIISTYDIYIKPNISEGRQVYVLQFPNRDSKQHYSAEHGAQPTNLRIKPVAGMVEVDIPMPVYDNYDRQKGVKWGDAITKSSHSKDGGSHGLPGGFGIGGISSGNRGKAKDSGVEDDEWQQILANFPDAVRQEKVLVKQTLGGQAIESDDTTPQYMIGTFRNEELHLTPVDKIVQMRPQFHHIDAHVELERTGRVAPVTTGQQPRAVHMSIKVNTDEEETSENIVQKIMEVQGEAWKSHQYIDESEGMAWVMYEDSLFVGEGSKEKPEILKKLPKLKSALENAEYLDTISEPRNVSKMSNKKIKKEKVGKGKQPGVEGTEGAEDPGVESDTFSSLSDPPSDEEAENTVS